MIEVKKGRKKNGRKMWKRDEGEAKCGHCMLLHTEWANEHPVII